MTHSNISFWPIVLNIYGLFYRNLWVKEVMTLENIHRTTIKSATVLSLAGYFMESNIMLERSS